MRPLLACLALTAFGSVAWACSCFTRTACPTLGDPKGPVFLGTPLEISDARGSGFLEQRKVRFRVEEAFGGVPAGRQEIEVSTGVGGGDCGIAFARGEVYLVFTSTNGEGLPRTGICSGTMPVKYATVALRVLRQKRDRQPVPSLIGQLNRVGRNDAVPMVPVAEMPVRVTVAEREYQSVTDASGIYSFFDLPAGPYTVAPDPRAGPTPAVGRPRMELTTGGCMQHDLYVEGDAGKR